MVHDIQWCDDVTNKQTQTRYIRLGEEGVEASELGPSENQAKNDDDGDDNDDDDDDEDDDDDDDECNETDITIIELILNRRDVNII